jgi:hypothetical protein
MFCCVYGEYVISPGIVFAIAGAGVLVIAFRLVASTAFSCKKIVVWKYLWMISALYHLYSLFLRYSSFLSSRELHIFEIT